MSAQKAWLPEQLQEAVDNQILSLTEAWALADLILLCETDYLELPEILEPQVDRLALWQTPVPNRLPL